MRKSRRGTCLAAFSVVGAMLVTGCGGSSGASGGNELHVLVGANADHPQQQAAWFAQLKRKFKKETGAKVVFQTFNDSSDETTKLETATVSGTGPDIFALGTTFTPVAFATHEFDTLTPQQWKQIGGRGRFIPESLAMSGPDPAHDIGVPSAIRPYGMVYNTKMFAAAGIKSPPKTWDELVADAAKLTRASSGVYGLALDYADGYDPWKYIWTLTEQQGGSFVSANGSKALLTSPQVNKATDSYFDLLTKHHIADPASAGWDSSKATAAFADGKAAILPMVTTEVVPSLDSSPVKGHYAFAPLPQVPFGMSQRPPGASAAESIVSGDDVGIAKYTDNKSLALKFVKLLTSKQEQLEQWKLFGYIPSNKQAAQQLASSDPRVAAFLKAENNSVPTAFTGGWSDIENGLTNVVKQSLPGLAKDTYSPAQVSALLQQANTTAQSAIKRSH